VIIGDRIDVVPRRNEIKRDQRDDSQVDHPQAGGTSMRVNATATRIGGWWAIEVPDVAGGLHT